MMSRGLSKRGIGTDVAVAVIVVLLIVAIAGYFLFSYRSGPITSATSTSSLNDTHTSFSTTSTQSGSATTPSASKMINSTSLVNNIGDIFGNFSGMTVYAGFNATTETVSYNVLGQSTINSSFYFEVNFTLSKLEGSVYQNSSARIWFDSVGNPSIVRIDGANYTGDQAQFKSKNYTAPFQLSILYSNFFLRNQSVLNELQYVNQNTTTVGTTLMKVVSYSCVCSPSLTIKPNVSVTGALLTIGSANLTGNKSVSILTYFALETSQGVSFAKVISITKTQS